MTEETNDKQDLVKGLVLKMPITLKGELILMPNDNYSMTADMTEESLLLAFHMTIRALENMIKKFESDLTVTRSKEGRYKKAVKILQEHCSDLISVLAVEIRGKAVEGVDMAQTAEMPVPTPPVQEEGGKIIKLPTLKQ